MPSAITSLNLRAFPYRKKLTVLWDSGYDITSPPNDATDATPIPAARLS